MEILRIILIYWLKFKKFIRINFSFTQDANRTEQCYKMSLRFLSKIMQL